MIARRRLASRDRQGGVGAMAKKMTRQCTQCAHQIPAPAGRADPLCGHPQVRDPHGGPLCCYQSRAAWDLCSPLGQHYQPKDITAP